MAQIFSVFANYGHMIEPRLVSKIISKEGAVIYETRPKEIVDFTEPEQAYLMTDILKGVVQRGTGRNAKVAGLELAGKTGTTNDGVDAWFCGYSPTITAITWFGRDNNRRIGKGATGGSVAAPAFAYFYSEVLKLYPDTPREFVKPEGVYSDILDGKLEIYTDISGLQNIQADNANPFEDDGSEVEVIKIDDDQIKETQDIEEQMIDPINLEKREPQKVGNDSGTLF